VPDHLPILRQIRRQRIPIWSELELASRHTQASRLVAVTGTNGKTTTTTLIGEFFKKAGRKTFVAGNIGLPLSAVAAKTSPASNVILEVSSYQLENIETFHPFISAILNITPDHLEHHGTMKAYVDAKARIFENQTAKDVCVLNADDAWCRKLAKKCPTKVFWFSRKKRLKNGIYYENLSLLPSPLPKGRGPSGARGEGFIVLRWNGHHSRWPLRSYLPGPHNIENILAAVAVAVAAGIPVSTMRQVLAAFRGVEHRLELVRTLRGVRYINDSKATNVDSTRVALLSFSDPLVLILGGEGKGSPYAPLKPLVRARAKRVLLIGEDAPRIARELRAAAPMERLHQLARAVRRARQVAEAGDVVLLSPACASFDQYNNYEERGSHFKALVRALH
jgi:UDP-N-acetylmuramoylalanine--D-glutamate ligase